MSANLKGPAVATRERSVLIPIPKKDSTKECANHQLYSSPMLERSCLKSCMLGFSIMRTKNFQMAKLGLKKEKEKELEIKLPTFAEL